MEIIGTYQGGYTPEENIKCNVQIDEYGIEIYPIDTSLYNKISRPLEKSEYVLKKFVGDKRFTYTWIIEYKDDNNKTQTILTTISKKEYGQIRKIRKELFYQENNKNRWFYLAIFTFVVATAISIIQITSNNNSNSKNPTENKNTKNSPQLEQDSLLSDTTINL